MFIQLIKDKRLGYCLKRHFFFNYGLCCKLNGSLLYLECRYDFVVIIYLNFFFFALCDLQFVVTTNEQ